jgi:hypothetical protein
MRLLIVSLVVLTLALPALLGAPPFYLQNAPSANAEHWLDFARTFIATLTGAGVAFVANRHLQERARRLEQLAAGNFAMATLTRQYNGFLNIRRMVQEERKFWQDEMPSAPIWLMFRPVIHFLQEKLEFDFESLVFLFDTHDIEFFQQLHLAEAVQRDLLGFVARLGEAARRKQEMISAAEKEAPGKPLSVGRVKDLIGPMLAIELENVVEQIVTHCENDGAIYLNAARVLHRALSKHLGPGHNVIKLVA